MTIDETLISKLEKLAKLSLTSQERNLLKQDLEKMIDMVNKLKEVDTQGVEPLIHMTDEKSILREDRVGEMLSQEDALKNAKNHDSAFFQVPNLFKKSSTNK
jgi:aspartyl-tRNA(Asn)/glutamyl-tRNA(Gln) amidotransferase subunit C